MIQAGEAGGIHADRLHHLVHQLGAALIDLADDVADGDVFALEAEADKLVEALQCGCTCS
jgi:hypothetical protein